MKKYTDFRNSIWLEIAIVFVIIILLFAMAYPAYKRVYDLRERSKLERKAK